MKELSLHELAEIGRGIRSRLMLRTRPLAIKFIKKPEDFPAKIKFPHKDLGCKVAFCLHKAVTPYESLKPKVKW